MYNPLHPPPAPPGFGRDKDLPQDNASLWSKLVFNWLTPFLSVGFSRPLEKDDLYTLPDRRHTHNLTDRIENSFYSRVPPKERPKGFVFGDEENDSVDHTNGANGASEKEKDVEVGSSDDGREGKTAEATRGKKAAKKYDSSLLHAIHSAFFWRWWYAGVMKLLADTLKTTTPLVTRLLLTWLEESFNYHRFLNSGSQLPNTGETVTKPRGIGYGIGLGFAIFAMQEVSSLLTNHFMMTTMTNGLCVRTGVIGAIFRKSLRLSGKARISHGVGQVTTMISTDATRLDLCSQYVHNLWVAPIQIAIGIGLLINNLGVSALVGLGVLVLGFPVQFLLVRVMFRARRKGVVFTDRRVRFTTEILQGIRLIKFFAWEQFYGENIGKLREAEVRQIRRAAIARATMISVVTMIPILASILSFITYALIGHALNPAIIFSSLQYFNIIRMPLVFFPLVLTSCSDAVVALGRIGKFLTAEELEEPYAIDDEMKWAVKTNATFAWETVGKPAQAPGGKFGRAGQKGKGAAAAAQQQGGKTRGRSKGKKDKKGGPILPTTAADASGSGEKKKSDGKPFELRDLQLNIPRGSFIAIVGRVGSGKSSLLQGLVGEMRRVSGEVVFGGTVAYVPQQAWIMNATLRENILFGLDFDEKRFNEVVRTCQLEHDIDMLPNGVDTEIGEKGINLSGGQKARVSLARSVYSDADVVLLDDPLSAVDAHVGKALLEQCFMNDGPLAGKTRVLVTHALHVLAQTDYIYVMENGVIAEQGTFQTLMKDGKAFSQLIEEYGAEEEEEKEDEMQLEKEKSPKGKSSASSSTEDVDKGVKAAARVAAKPLMSEEERNRGAVPMSVYAKYLRHAGGVIWAPVIVGILALMQGASVSNNLFLGFWTNLSIKGFREGDYMAVYTALGISQAIFSFCASFTFSLVALYGGLRIFKAALSGVLRSPISFFDTTPMGRVMSRLSKDQDVLDTQLSMTLYQLLSTFSNVIGTVALVFYTFPLLGIIFAPLSVMYYGVSLFYRRSSVETKRLDSLMRSALYASYSETLTGLSTVRAYGEQGRFITSAEHGLDLENRAYYMTVSIQRWLSVRLDILGNILILGIALFAAGFRNTVNPSKVGVVLSYSLTITQVFSDMVSQYAQNEQNMNAVERILVYVDLPPEGDLKTPNDPPSSWPEQGAVSFKNVKLAYREGLPLVLKDVSFEVKPGEKVGIVGRTGAGKSSLLQALFRMVEVKGGTIEIDGRNTRAMGLDILRRQLALVPQDSTLFLGTLRDNLDPHSSRTDAEINSALRRAWLLPREGSPPDPIAEAKFKLDATVTDEGANFSAGEKQLLALARALLKGSRIIVLDEATSSVDVETDSKLQKTIQSEFSSCTLLCIAHRLNTIVYYDRVLVMDAGRVAEFDTPLNLFDDENSIFRSLCDEAKLTRDDIVRIRAGNEEPFSNNDD
ncbi:multidrug resistance-associated ABC transporter [Schizopora paradoxa]|uniref:Multidrug resistance-associated ABC transporter n=1 Tax=Schizopora paradoxa TaxID=27342 RepID=A0A0H2RPB8_9AGAM|nr:multidrug resistance-associated ABC transporter [Schizopora paradoxa]